VNQPTLFLAGEARKRERVDISPGGGNGPAAVSVSIGGPVEIVLESCSEGSSRTRLGMASGRRLARGGFGKVTKTSRHTRRLWQILPVKLCDNERPLGLWRGLPMASPDFNLNWTKRRRAYPLLQRRSGRVLPVGLSTAVLSADRRNGCRTGRATGPGIQASHSPNHVTPPCQGFPQGAQ
jgi:hypothetical protein